MSFRSLITTAVAAIVLLWTTVRFSTSSLLILWSLLCILVFFVILRVLASIVQVVFIFTFMFLLLGA